LLAVCQWFEFLVECLGEAWNCEEVSDTFIQLMFVALCDNALAKFCNCLNLLAFDSSLSYGNYAHCFCSKEYVWIKVKA